MIVNVLQEDGTTVNVIQSSTPNVIEVVTAGPQGPVGPPGSGGGSINTGSLLTTASFNSYTGSSTSQFAGTASYALTASFALNGGGNINTGSFVTTSSFNSFTSSYNSGSFTGSFSGSFSGTFSGSGANLSDIPASGIVGLNLSQISSGSVSASISEQTGLQVNTNITAPTFSGSFSGSGANLFNIPASGITGLNLSQIVSGSVSASISPNSGLQVNTNVTATSFTGSLQGTASNSTSASYALNSTSASYALTSSYSNNSTSASYALTSSYSNNSTSASYSVNATNAATASNILGGVATHIPFFITNTTLATSSIYQSGSGTIIINQDNATSANPEALYVYQPHPTSINVISGKGDINNYLQLNIQNTNQGVSASSDVVATANNGNETTNYIDMGINSQNYNANFIGNANDAYLYSTGNDLHIGNASDKPVQIFAGGSDVDIHNKLILNPNNQHTMSGSLDVSGSVKAFSFTGSLQGNASTATTATTATSASHATIADSATFATTAGNGGVTSIIAGSGIVLPFGGTGAVTIVSSGGGGVTIISGSAVTSSFANSSTWTFTHNLGTRTPTITVFDSSYNQIIPQNIQLVDTASATITFPTLESGFAIASTGGTSGTALSSSYSLFATYAASASYFPETDPIFVAKSGSLATTGSNIFIGNQIVTGSLRTSGSNTLIGNTVLTGSFSVSGSTVQTGNNTLIGNTILTGTTSMTGSILVSGSQTFIGNNSLTGSLSISGSTTQIGNNTLIGTTTLTGSIQIAGDLIPQISASFDLGSVTNPWRTIYLQSGSISIRSDIPGNPDVIISNTDGDITITSAGFQIKSGSTTPFVIDTVGRTKIFTPNIPVNDQGAFSIVGSGDGYAQTIGLAGRMIHITGNDNLPSRVENDSFGAAAFPAYIGRSARGVASSPSASQNGDILSRLAALGYGDTGYLATNVNSGPPINSIDFVAKQNYNDTSASSAIQFYTSPQNARVRTLSTTIDATGITIPSSSLLFGTASWAQNSLTASSVRPLTQDVIITGSLKVSGSITEIGDATVTGSLRVTGSLIVNGPVVFNDQTATITGSLLITGSGFINSKPILTSANTSSFQNGFGWYGAFCSTGSQTNPVANVSRSMQLDTVEHSNGVSLVSGSRITFQHGGVYNIQFSAQLESTSAGDNLINIWFKKNGSNVARSNTLLNLSKQAGDKLVAAWNYIDTANANEYYEIVWQSADTGMQLHTEVATGNIPVTPSVIITATQVG